MRAIEGVMTDPAASRWLQEALRSALARDAVDAARDARALADLLERRADALLQAAILAARGPR